MVEYLLCNLKVKGSRPPCAQILFRHTTGKFRWRKKNSTKVCRTPQGGKVWDPGFSSTYIIFPLRFKFNMWDLRCFFKSSTYHTSTRARTDIYKPVVAMQDLLRLHYILHTGTLPRISRQSSNNSVKVLGITRRRLRWTPSVIFHFIFNLYFYRQ